MKDARTFAPSKIILINNIYDTSLLFSCTIQWILYGFLVTAPAGDIVCKSTHITMSLAYKPLSLSMLGVVVITPTTIKRP